MFFFNHAEPEAEVPGLMSKKNDFEAEMIEALARYSAVCLIQALLIQKSCWFRQVIMVPAEPIVLHFAFKANS